ncbi:helix-turn-helix transcriptional regulator [Spongiactinospora rosea]|uniref:helix-turn-helix transcriptional regulator n=1 Tax=Spongiactinospora rosea TaxID=2248750 RepID=UPI0013149AD7|nr:LuxR family transcriptional regulator [Spongiactinospora rosea]
MRRNALVGRDGELAGLRDALDRSPHRGGTLILRGEAGVGKSALLAAARTEAAGRRLRVLRIAAVQAEFRLPFAGVDTLLRQLAGGAAVSGQDNPYQVALTVLTLLTEAAEDRPLVLSVEDAQWLDQPSWEALAFVGRRLEADPVLLLMAMRDGEETEARLAGAGLAELRVPPLDQAHAAALLDRHAPGLRPDLRSRVLTEAAGNPLGLMELAVAATRFGEDTLPPASLPLTTRLERTFAVVVSQLPAPTRSLLLVAALNDGDRLDEILTAGSLEAGEPVTLAALEPAVSARLLDIDSTYRVSFRHPLVRSSIRQQAGPVKRRQVHAALAQVLRDADRRVWHRAAVTIGPDEEIAADLAAMAERARERGALSTAVAALQRAAQLCTRPAERSCLLVDAAELAYDVGDSQTFEQLLRVISEPDLPAAERARLHWMREIAAGEWSGASRFVSHAAIAERMLLAGDTDRAVRTLQMISLRCWWSNPDPATREAILAVADRLDLDPLDPRLLYVLALAGPIERGADTLDRLSHLMSQDEPGPVHLHLLAVASGALGAPGPSIVFMAAAVAGLRDQGRLGLLAQALVHQAFAAAQLGDTVLALTAATEAGGLAAETGQGRWVLTAQLTRAQAEALRGNGEAARALADQAERMLLSIGAYPMLAMVQQVRGIDALSDGRYAEAYDHLRRIVEPTDTAYHAYMRFSVLAYLAEAGTRCGRHDDVRRVAAELEPFAAATGSPALKAGLACARALAAPDDAAEPLFLTGIADDLAAWPFERARLQLAYGAWLRRRRRSVESRPPLRAAIGALEALGAAPWAERARQELRASGETIRRARDGRDDLTPQERQIARLAAEGLPNREIAARLFLSSRTVSTHLYRIYPKLGVSSRTELARVMSATPGTRS